MSIMSLAHVSPAWSRAIDAMSSLKDHLLPIPFYVSLRLLKEASKQQGLSAPHVYLDSDDEQVHFQWDTTAFLSLSTPSSTVDIDFVTRNTIAEWAYDPSKEEELFNMILAHVVEVVHKIECK